MNNEHEKYMKTALSLASKGRSTRPNPMVGCVIVKNNKIISEGYHECCGKEHAEAVAIRRAGLKAKNAGLYVTLEPCAHWGRTPPCTDLIIKAGIKKVVFAMRDPNPLVNGKGIKMLKKAGVETVGGIMSSEAEYLNREFIVNIKQKRPYVLLKQAQSLDGKIASRTGDSKWISSQKSREAVHSIRANFQAVMSGINTVIRDNPHFTSHGAGSNPIRIVIDKMLDLPLKSKFLDGNARRIIITGRNINPKKVGMIERMGCEIYQYPLFSGKLRLKKVLMDLYEKGICCILLEAGGGLNASFMEAGLVDEVLFFIAPKLIGGSEAITSIEGLGVSKVKNAWPLKDVRYDVIEGDIVVNGLVVSRLRS